MESRILTKSLLIFICSCSLQLHRSSSPPSILLSRLMTDTPRDATSTSLPPCHLFMCKLHPLYALKCSRPGASVASVALRYRPNLFLPTGVESPGLMGAGRLYLPFRIKGLKHVHVQHEPHVRDTQMNMCQRHGNESRARGSLGAGGSQKTADQPLSSEGSS